jgi:hypothetical protein
MSKKEILDWAIDSYCMLGEINNEGKDEGKCLLNALIVMLKKDIETNS